MSDLIQGFPEGFLWGAATSAHQVEGDNVANDWWRFEQEPGTVHNCDRSGPACRHWEMFDSDFALAQSDGHNAHRLSLEWSRIEPRRGNFDAVAVAHYHEVFASLERRGLKPIVTLHHFTNPLWIADRGGWESRETIDAFSDFVKFCAREYGGEVDWWCTVNEPEVYAFRSYSEALWPPRKRDDSAALAVIANLLEAHGRAYRILHAEDKADADGDGRNAMVGFAKHMTELVPLRPWFPLDVLRTWFEDRVFNRAVLEAPVTGEIALSIPGARGVKRRVPELERSIDYMGLNYYTRWHVDSIGHEAHVAAWNSPVTDLDWEIHPAGLGEAARRASHIGAPVLVTEHGFADAHDEFRPRALVESLHALGQAIAHGARVCGYLHWSLMDNFEWSDGYKGRFGLYAVDFGDPNRPRRRTRSAQLYSRIVKANGIEEDVARTVWIGS